MQWFSKSKGSKGGVGKEPTDDINRPRLAFAHFMLGNTYPFTEEDWLKTFDLAEDTSIDALALNIGPEEWQLTQAFTAYRLIASSASTYNLKLFLSLDLMVLPKDPSVIIAKIIQIVGSGKSAQLRWDNKLVLSTFGGHDLGDEGWRKVIREVENTLGEKVFFIPSFFLPPEEILKKDYVDGAFHWNGAWPMSNSTINLDSDKPFLKHKKPYTAAVSPLFFTHYGTEGDWAFNKNWIYRSDDLPLPTRFSQLLSLPPNESPQFIEIISWNDFGESHYIGPIMGAQPGSERWTQDMDHEGFRVLSKFYIEKWKIQGRVARSQKGQVEKGGEETGEKGKLVVWYRTQSKNMVFAQDRVGKPDHSEWAQDLINIFLLPPSPSPSSTNPKEASKEIYTLHIRNGPQSHYPIPIEIGKVNLMTIPFQPGSVTFQLIKNPGDGDREVVVIDAKGKDIQEQGDGGGWNYNFWSGIYEAV